MAISLLAYVATLSGQLYFWRSYFFTLVRCNYFNTAATVLEQLFLQSSCFYERAPFSKQSLLRSSYFFQNSYFFRAKVLPSSHFLKADSSLRQLLFRTATFLTEELFRIKIPTEELLFGEVTLAQLQLFQKRYILEKANYLEKQYSAFPTFSEELPF